MSNAQKRPINVSMSAHVVEEAKEAGMNISAAAEQGVVAELARRRRDKWVEENWEAIQAHNEWVENNELPLAKYRMF